jgi:hypothetical protein
MIIEAVIIKTDSGETITMPMDKVEAFFDSVERMKLAADPKRRDREKLAEATLRMDDVADAQMAQQQRMNAMRVQELMYQERLAGKQPGVLLPNRSLSELADGLSIRVGSL